MFHRAIAQSGCLRSSMTNFTPTNDNPVFDFLMQKFELKEKEAVIEKLQQMETKELVKLGEKMDEMEIPYKFNFDQEFVT